MSTASIEFITNCLSYQLVISNLNSKHIIMVIKLPDQPVVDRVTASLGELIASVSPRLSP